jgi:hypothetical protein
MIRGIVRAVIVTAVLGAVAPASAKDTHWEARLATVPIDPATAASVTGHGRATADLSGRSLRIAGSFTGLQGAATIAQLHEGPKTGVRGDVVADLDVTKAASGSVSGTVRLTGDQLDALRAGRLYIQIHSTSAPDGNLWGWLLP